MKTLAGIFLFFGVSNSGYFQAKSAFACGGPMFAPALVGVMPLSVVGFETCRSQLSSPGGSAVEGRPISLLVAKSEEVPRRRSVTNCDIRGPIRRPSQSSLASASINSDRRSVGSGSLSLRIQAERSPRSRAWQRHGGIGRPRAACESLTLEDNAINHRGRILTWLSPVRVSGPIDS